MSRNKLISSYNLEGGKQIQTFQTRAKNINQEYMIQSKNGKKNMLQKHQNECEGIIYLKISQVDNLNKKLLQISNRITNTSIVCTNEQKLHPVIYRIQEQMKTAFNQLIQSIQQFYFDIDSKIKEIGVYLAGFSGTDTHETSNNCHQQLFPQVNQNSNVQFKNKDNQNLRSIVHKIDSLQKDLDDTKNNERKLMTIIEKLISKYQLTHETTMVRQDPFLKKKLNTILDHLERNSHIKTATQNIYAQQIGRNNSNNTFFHNGDPYNMLSDKSETQRNAHIVVKSSLQTSNALDRGQKRPHKIAQNVHHQNDYSIYQQLNKIQQNSAPKRFQSNQQNYIISDNSGKPEFQKAKMSTQRLQKRFDTSTVSANSYAVSNSFSQLQQDQCFIKKLYSKQSPSLNKVSLKGCNNYFQFKKKQQPIDPANKNHREAFLMRHLKR